MTAVPITEDRHVRREKRTLRAVLCPEAWHHLGVGLCRCMWHRLSIFVCISRAWSWVLQSVYQDAWYAGADHHLHLRLDVQRTGHSDIARGIGPCAGEMRRSKAPNQSARGNIERLIGIVLGNIIPVLVPRSRGVLRLVC